MGIKTNKTLKSAVWYTASNVLAKAITLLITPVFTRLLSKAEYGEYTNFVSWQNILLTIFSLELSATVLRAKFDRENEGEFESYVFTISWFSIIVTVVLSLLLCILNTNVWIKNIIGIDQKYIWLLCLIIVFSPILQIYQAQQRAEIKYKTSSIVTIAYGMFSFIIPYVLVRISQNGLHALLHGLAMNVMIWGLVILIYISSRKRGRVHLEDIKYALMFSLPIIPHLVSSIIMGNSDKIMIKNMSGPEFAAMYGLVYTCALAINLLRNSLNNAWIPWFYRKMNDKDYASIRHVSKVYIVLFSVGSLLVCLLGPEIVWVLGGNQYKEALLLVPIIMLGCYYNFLNLFYVNIEFYAKKTSMISVVTVGTAGLNLALNYIFISKYGYSAAAYTTAFCNFCIIIFHYVVTKKMMNSEICDNKMIFISSGISLAVVFFCIILYKVFVMRLIVFLCVALFTIVYLRSVKKKGILGKGGIK